MEKVFLYHGTSDKIVTPFWGEEMTNMIMGADFI